MPAELPRPRPPRRGPVGAPEPPMSHQVSEREQQRRVDIEREGATLHDVMDGRASIEQAKGVLVERHQFSPPDAYRLLADLSQYTGVRVRAIADLLLIDQAACVDGVEVPRLRWVCELLDNLPQPAMLLVPAITPEGTISTFEVHHVNPAAQAMLPTVSAPATSMGRSDIPVARLLTLDNAIVVRWRSNAEIAQ